MTERQIKKQQLLDQLYQPYTQCTQCPLGLQGRARVVFGSGNPDAELMFIGEGPGREEDAQGLPFVGKSGALLSKLLDLHGLQRSDIFITNMVKCRPPNNRRPLPYEMNTCKKLLLLHQIRIINPRVICTLGSTALAGLLETEVKITQLRGKIIQFGSIQLIPTYHPAFVLRNPKELPNLADDIGQAVNLYQNNPFSKQPS